MPRERNGYIDDGHQISNASKHCPNCNSTDYTETVSLERCKTCGLEFDYWGEGGNAVYKAWAAARQEREEWASRFRDQEDDDE